MADLNFYNQNAHRSYPLKGGADSAYTFGALTVPDSVLLDVGIMVGLRAAYDEHYRVKLSTVTKAGTTITLAFETELADATFYVAADVGDAFGTVHQIDAVEGSEYGWMFAAVGDLSALASFGDATYSADGNYYVEEGLVQSLHDSYVRTLNLAVAPYSAWGPPAACGGSTGTAPESRNILVQPDLTGSLKFRAGYNASVSIVGEANAVEIGADAGGGAGEPCGRIVAEEYGRSSASSNTYLECADVMNTINGIRPDASGNFILRSDSPGIVVTPHPDEHKIVVEFLGGTTRPFCKVDWYGSSSSGSL